MRAGGGGQKQVGQVRGQARHMKSPLPHHALRLPLRPSGASAAPNMSAEKRPFSSKVSSFRNYLSQARADPRSALHHASGRDPRHEGAETPPVDSSRTQSWGQWAGQKLKQITHGNEDDAANLEKVFVFPGWATRNYHQEGASASSPGVCPSDLEAATASHQNSGLISDAPFDVHVSVSGWASSHNAPGILSRSQRAFIRLAKGSCYFRLL